MRLASTGSMLVILFAPVLAGCMGTIGEAGGSSTGPAPGGSPGGANPGANPGGNPGGNPGANPGVPPGSVDPGAGAQAECTSGVLPVAATSVRLNERQFRNTIAALIPFPVDIGTKYPVTVVHEDFSTSLTANEVLFANIQSFTETAESIALQAVGRIGDLVPCHAGPDQAACARQFIVSFASKAYRRPVDNAERDQLIALYDSVRRPPDPLDFNLAMAAVISAVLQSPQFLYRLEVGQGATSGGLRTLSPYEVASRLSYLYWDSPPDERLLELARSGALADKRTIGTEAERMLNDPRAKESIWRFFSEWLGYGDRVLDSRTDRALALDMAEETRRFVMNVFDSPGAPFRDLLDNDKTVLNQRLAQHYGVQTASTGPNDWQPATLGPNRKAGVLAKAQVAAAHSAVGETSIILRGKFLHDRFLCFELGAPPPNAVVMNPTLPAGSTVRQLIDARQSVSGCGGCHRYLDFAGVGMEDIDHLGRFRSKYQSGQDVDVAGQLLALDSDDDKFSGSAGLARKLASSPQVAECLARQWYRYAMGRHETEAENKCHVLPMSKRFADAGQDLKQLMLSVSASDAFIHRTGGPVGP